MKKQKDLRITKPKAAIAFLKKSNHSYEDYEKYGLKPSRFERNDLDYNLKKVIHPELFKNNEFLNILTEYLCNIPGRNKDILEIAKESFPKGFLVNNPDFIMNILKNKQSNIMTLQGCGRWLSSSWYDINSFIPNTFFTPERSEELENIFKKDVNEKYASIQKHAEENKKYHVMNDMTSANIELLREKIAQFKLTIEEKKKLNMDEVTIAAAQFYDSITPQLNPQLAKRGSKALERRHEREVNKLNEELEVIKGTSGTIV